MPEYDYYYSINLSTSVYYDYDANGNYERECDVFPLITFNYSSDNSYRFDSISGPALVVNQSPSYSTNPFVTVALRGQFSGDFVITVRWKPSSSVASDVIQRYHYTIDNSEKTLRFIYIGLSGEIVDTVQSIGGTSSVKYVRRIPIEETSNFNGYVYTIDSWRYVHNSNIYDPYQLGVFDDNGEEYRFDVNSYSNATSELYLVDYPNKGTNTRQTLNRCVSGTGLTKFTIPQNPSSQHYNFNGFFNRNNTIQYTAGQQLEASRDYSVYARWTGKTYTVSFNINTTGTTPSSINPVSIVYSDGDDGLITLPSLSKTYYTFNGWSDGTNVYPSNYRYRPTGNITLTSVFTPLTYTVIFKDADGTTEATRSAPYGSSVTVDAKNRTPYFDFLGWYLEGTDTRVISPTAQTYAPSSNITVIRRYSYTRFLKSSGSTEITFATVTRNYPQPMSFPTQSNHDAIMDVSGYRIKGWSLTKQTPSPATNPNTDYTTEYIPDLDDDFTSFYIALIPASLNSITLSNTLLVKVGIDSEVSRSTNPPTLQIDPPDWLGSLTWESTDEDNTFFTLTGQSMSAIVRGKYSTYNQPAKYIRAYAHKDTWNSQSAIITSNDMKVDVSDFLQVDFYTRDNSGREIKYIPTGRTNNLYYIDNQNNQLIWKNLDGTTEGAYPPNPERNGYQFISWLDGDNMFVDFTHPPDHPTICRASWMTKYTEQEKDVLILQKMNPEGNAIELQLDMGVIESVNENFELNITKLPTPTMTSDNTFLTDLNVGESIPFKTVRKHPVDYNDDTDDSTKWSNGKWISEVRKIVDRWQSATDGIKVLYIPYGMRKTRIGTDDVCYGYNYDLLGYCLPKEGNVGLLYDYDESQNDYNNVLVGYNGIITSYSDTYTAGNPSTISVSLTIRLGGMKAQYQDLARGLLQQ